MLQLFWAQLSIALTKTESAEACCRFRACKPLSACMNLSSKVQHEQHWQPHPCSTSCLQPVQNPMLLAQTRRHTHRVHVTVKQAAGTSL